MSMRIAEGNRRLVTNANVPHMLECISAAVANANLNILDLLNRSTEQIACTMLDVEQPIIDSVVDEIGNCSAYSMYACFRWRGLLPC